jgi:hypothetical protein
MAATLAENRYHGIYFGKFNNVAADVPASVVALMLATQRPMNVAALNEPVSSAAWTSKPTWQIITLQDHVTISNPDIVAGVIEEAARAAAIQS